jgi:integrase/recombinase XerD
MARMNIPYYLTPEEAERLIAVPNPRYPTGIRNHYLIRFLLGTGLRCSEALAVKVTDLDLKNHRVVVRNGKRRRGEKKPRQRVVSLSRALTDALELYVSKRPWDSEYLFSTAEAKALKDSYIRAMLARYGERANIPRRVHPHQLRHSYATRLYDSGVDLTVIQSQLGHDRLTTTAIYAHASGRYVQQQVAGLPF